MPAPYPRARYNWVMRITVFGATSLTARTLLPLAAARGIETVGYARDTTGLAADHRISGQADDLRATTTALAGSDAAVVTYGMGRRSRLYSAGTQTIIQAMRDQQVKRLIVVSEASYGRHLRDTTPAKRAMAALYAVTRRHAVHERLLQDAILGSSGLAWTALRPPTLRDRPAAPSPAWTLDPARNLRRTSTYTTVATVILDILPDESTHARDLYL
ncbi:hypothetical protein GCM10027589_13460 [Actinocorallia lasiicapitis]